MGDVLTGLRCLARGQHWVWRNRRWWGFGLLPALLSLVLYSAALLLLCLRVGDLAAWATPFADAWDHTARSVLRDLVAILLLGGGVLLAVVTFTSVTLLVGDPFYESLSGRVEDAEGGAPRPSSPPLWRSLLTAAGESLAILLRVTSLSLLLFALGFVPVLGQTVVPVLGFCVSGFFLAVELTSFAFQRRSVPLRERLRLLRRRLGLALGFGVPLVLLFLVPLAAVVLMPGAVAGATLMIRDVLPAAAPSGPVATDGAPAAAAGEPAPGGDGGHRGPAGPEGGVRGSAGPRG